MTAVFLVGLNFYPIHSQHITRDRGVWEDSWNLDYGWPRRVCQEWKLEENAGVFWSMESVVFNGRIVLGVSSVVFVAVLTLLSLPRRRVGRRASRLLKNRAD